MVDCKEFVGKVVNTFTIYEETGERPEICIESTPVLLSQITSTRSPTTLRPHLRRKLMARTVMAILTVTGFFLAVLPFQPFRLGWQAHVFCGGFTTVVPFLIHRLLQDHRLEPLIKGLTAIAAAVGIASLMLMAGIRGTVLAHEVRPNAS
jgi:hypothetical protein